MDDYGTVYYNEGRHYSSQKLQLYLSDESEYYVGLYDDNGNWCGDEIRYEDRLNKNYAFIDAGLGNDSKYDLLFNHVRSTSDDEICAFVLADYYIYVDNTEAFRYQYPRPDLGQNLLEFIDLIHAPTIYVNTVDKTKSGSIYDDIWRETYQIRD